MNKYQKALNNIKKEAGTPYFSSLYDIDDWKEDFKTLQELVDKETPLTPEYKLTKMVYKTHYLDKDYEMKYHCPKCDSVVYPLDRCDRCNQKLDWNKYYIIEEKENRIFYYKRSDTDE